MSLGDRMKYYEAQYEKQIQPYQSYVLRLDGTAFSKFTSNLNQPFDLVFEAAKQQTLVDLMNHYPDITTSYTHSDELTLVVHKRCTKEEFLKGEQRYSHMYGGRVQKLASLIASYCSVSFNEHFMNLVEKNRVSYSDVAYDNIKIYVKNNRPIFDCRCMAFTEELEYEVLNHSLWRSIDDCYRNCVSKYAQMHYSSKQLEGMSTQERCELLKEKDINVDTDVAPYLKYGMYCKRSERDDITTKTYEFRTFRVVCNEYYRNVFFSKYWPEMPKDEYTYVEILA